MAAHRTVGRTAVSDDVARVEIASIAAGGDGVARSNGLVVFVPRTAPGDLADVRITSAKRFARGRLVRLAQGSPSRVDPPCEHYRFDDCGGCQLQHLAYDAQLDAKSVIIGDALRRIARRNAADPMVEPSEAQWRYRRKLTLHLRRTASGWIAGLHPYDDPVAVFDLRDCPITERRVLDVWAELRPAFDLLPDAAELRVSVRLLPQGASVVVEGGATWRTHDRFLERGASIVELWWRPANGRPRLVGRRTVERMAGASFVQVNVVVADRLREHVLARARSHEPGKVVDAYAGTGSTSVPLARDGREVLAIELDGDAVATFRHQLAPPSVAVTGRVEDVLERALPADVVLLNPPRAGVDSRVTSALQAVERAPRAIVYVSCDPATLARDIARLPRYRLASVRAFDMFPQTAHVETVCELVPEAA